MGILRKCRMFIYDDFLSLFYCKYYIHPLSPQPEVINQIVFNLTYNYLLFIVFQIKQMISTLRQ